MVAKRIYRMMTCFLIFALLVLSLSIPASLAQDLSEAEIEKIEEIITTFASDPELGMKLLKDLAEENPELAVLTVIQLVREIPKLAVLEPSKVTPEVVLITVVDLSRTHLDVALRSLIRIAQIEAALHSILTLIPVEMIEDNPGAAALVVQSIKRVAPEIGRLLEEEVVAAGLERSYLLAASPIMP